MSGQADDTDGRDGPGAEGRESTTLAAKINYLFATVHPPSRAPYSDKEVEAWLKAHSGPTVSANYLRWLRRGERTNPSLETLQAIARFFDVDTAYLASDGATARAIEADLDALTLLREKGIRGLAARASRMDPDEREWWLQMMDGRPQGSATRRRPQPPASRDDADDT